MKLKSIIPLAAAIVVITGITGCMHRPVESDARITKAQAQDIALQKAPGGKIKEAELEKEKGRLIWSFEITTEGTKEITEVNIDANTGEVVAIEKE